MQPNASSISPTLHAVIPLGNVLSKRQLEIAELIGNGHSVTYTAWALGISINTMRVHLRKLKARYGVDAHGLRAAIQAANGC